MQQHAMRDRQEYGPLIDFARVSPRVAQIGSVVLPLADIQPPLPPPLAEPSSARVEDYYESIMRELCVKNDEVAALSALRSDQDKTFQIAEAQIRNTETQLPSESQQRDLAMSMAMEVSTRFAEVCRQYERAHLEQTAQARRMTTAMAMPTET